MRKLLVLLMCMMIVPSIALADDTYSFELASGLMNSQTKYSQGCSQYMGQNFKCPESFYNIADGKTYEITECYTTNSCRCSGNPVDTVKTKYQPGENIPYVCINSCCNYAWNGKIINAPFKIHAIRINCKEDWQCTEWSECSLDNKKNRACHENNECVNIEYKPPEQASCECVEDWECSEWSLCEYNKRDRICFEKNGCLYPKHTPAKEEYCTTFSFSSETGQTNITLGTGIVSEIGGTIAGYTETVNPFVALAAIAGVVILLMVVV